ncbi:MAG: prepilin-type N-terminal cleavage/methylation domain-containing protein [Aquabacterium sp.]|nr:prepilin-type N-terminal cleavage/methylation domain-containing protein [Aquabacterium sp.]
MTQAASTSCRSTQRGFSLVELIVVIVVTGIIAATLTSFLKPAMDSYINTRYRADMSYQSDMALRRMLRDVRRAVPNSLRVPDSQCFELVPAVAGGRYRMGPDAVNDSPPLPVGCTPTNPANSCAAWIDPSQTSTMFDSLSTLQTVPAVGDWVVINNQNGNDVYTAANRSVITAINTPALTQGKHRISMSSLQVSVGYTGGRFLTVSNSEQSVFYICSGATGVNTRGNGSGTLYRLVRPFNAAYPSACPSTAGAVVVATNVKSCSFIYDPNQGATLQSGFLWMDLALSRNNEAAHMAVGAHVMNVP